MKKVVISGSGVFTPESIITNEELVASFNQYVDLFNAENAEAINAGEVAALEYSSCRIYRKSLRHQVSSCAV
ncbi:MAG: hypothetical protein U5L01_14415 [Rheinheimera sp.]|nr:hypothetical protein [Rheinheimera sp.]